MAPRIRRLSRRLFLTDLGRGTLAVTVLGPAAVACGSDPDPDAAPGSTAPATSTGPGSSTAAPSSTTPSTSPASTDGSAGEALRWARVDAGFVSAYVLVRGREAAVVDTATSGNEAAIESALGSLGTDFTSVGHVVLTHHHPDHVGGLGGVLAATPDAIVYAGEADIASIESAQALQAVGDGDEIFGLQVIHTPGHTPGHISVFDPDSGVLVAGDALVGADGGLAGPDPDFTEDLDTAHASVAKMAERPVDAVLMGHGTPVESGAGPLLTDLAASLG